MRILCIHGYFLFFPETATQLSRFKDQFDLELYPKDDYYTFEGLLDAPTYSIVGADYMGVRATQTFSGKPWEVFAKNGLVWNLASKRVAFKQSIIGRIDSPLSGYYFSSDTLIIQPGQMNALGRRLVSYDARLNEKTQSLHVSRFDYE